MVPLRPFARQRTRKPPFHSWRAKSARFAGMRTTSEHPPPPCANRPGTQIVDDLRIPHLLSACLTTQRSTFRCFLSGSAHRVEMATRGTRAGTRRQMDCPTARTSPSRDSDIRAFFIRPFPREIATASAASLQDLPEIVRQHHVEMEGFICNGARHNPHGSAQSSALRTSSPPESARSSALPLRRIRSIVRISPPAESVRSSALPLRRIRSIVRTAPPPNPPIRPRSPLPLR
jgi:hypothetical protein